MKYGSINLELKFGEQKSKPKLVIDPFAVSEVEEWSEERVKRFAKEIADAVNDGENP